MGRIEDLRKRLFGFIDARLERTGMRMSRKSYELDDDNPMRGYSFGSKKEANRWSKRRKGK